MTYLLIFNPITLLAVYILYTRLTKDNWLYYPVLIVGAVLDMLVNLTWATVIFLDLPRELLLTQRTERLKSAPGYRGIVANKLCRLLNYFQPGHCK